MAANWKMYKTGAEAAATVKEMAEILNGTAPEGREIVVFVPFTALEKASEAMQAIEKHLHIDFPSVHEQHHQQSLTLAEFLKG